MGKKTQFYAYKLSLKKIIENNKDIKEIDISTARKNDELIGLSDNQVLRHLRIIYGKELDELKDLQERKQVLRNKKNSKSAKNELAKILKKLNDILLIDEIVNITVDSSEEDYDDVVKNGFFVNNIRYRRFACGSGMARRANVSFISDNVLNKIHEILMNGLELDEINIAKLNAYYGLYLSGCEFVSEPSQVVVIPDYEPILKDKKVDWIYDVSSVDEDGRKYEYRDIEPRVMDIKANVFDGQGLISPHLCRKWAEDLDLNYTPCSFIIRTCFTKGLVVEFDFHRYAREKGITTIKDKWGKEYNIENVDMILTESQMKMHKYYKSWDHFLENHKKYNHAWSVTRYNKPSYKEDVMTRLNYQYIQTLSLDKDKIIKLAEPTLEWIKSVCEGDKLNSLLFLLGVSKETDALGDVFDKVNNTYVEAILKHDRFLKEEQIQKFMYNSIKKYIKESKIGKLWVKGKYEFMISDPYALTQWALGQEVTGLLKEHEHWSKNKIDHYDGCRSPLVDDSEHNLLNFINTEETRKWLSHIETGVIYNIFGLDTIIHSDSDYDGDIVFTTNNEIMVNNITPNQLPITYDKSSAPSQKITIDNIIKTDLASFDCKVGPISNISTNFGGIAPLVEDYKPYKDVIIKRRKLLRRYIGDSIDSAKGIEMKNIPKTWTRKNEIYESDDISTRRSKHAKNKIVAYRKPYFMIDLYDSLNEEYQKYRKDKEIYCKLNYRCSINELQKKGNKTEEEKLFIKEYYDDMPVLASNCIMNELSWYIDSWEKKNIVYKNKFEDCTDLMIDTSIPKNKNTFKMVEELYKEFMNEEKNLIKKNRETESFDKTNNGLSSFYDETRDKALLICNNDKEFANYAVEICYKNKKNKNKHKRFVWCIARDGLLKNIELHKQDKVEIPVLDKYGQEYLGKKYSLKEIVEKEGLE